MIATRFANLPSSLNRKARSGVSKRLSGGAARTNVQPWPQCCNSHASRHHWLRLWVRRRERHGSGTHSSLALQAPYSVGVSASRLRCNEVLFGKRTFAFWLSPFPPASWGWPLFFVPPPTSGGDATHNRLGVIVHCDVLNGHALLPTGPVPLEGFDL
jgi:hypothetical protein